MNTQLVLVNDERGFTVHLSTTHPTQAEALAHFTDVLTQLHHQHPAAKPGEAAAASSTTMANTADP